jgi:hypothetical protein
VKYFDQATLRRSERTRLSDRRETAHVRGARPARRTVRSRAPALSRGRVSRVQPLRSHRLRGDAEAGCTQRAPGAPLSLRRGRLESQRTDKAPCEHTRPATPTVGGRTRRNPPGARYDERARAAGRGPRHPGRSRRRRPGRGRRQANHASVEGLVRTRRGSRRGRPRPEAHVHRQGSSRTRRHSPKRPVSSAMPTRPM